MRITGGRDKGRRLTPLKGMSIRPTSDKVREAIFDLLGQDMREFRVLDLFSGTGSLGLEALSRGASRALFIDHSIRATDLLKKNVRLCGYEDRSEILVGDVIRIVKSQPFRLKGRFDVVFIDPPYAKNLIPEVLESLSCAGSCANPSIVVVESSKMDELPDTMGRLEMTKYRTYGDTKITLYRCEDEP